jgi:hypothetical protein
LLKRSSIFALCGNEKLGKNKGCCGYASSICMDRIACTFQDADRPEEMGGCVFHSQRQDWIRAGQQIYGVQLGETGTKHERTFGRNFKICCGYESSPYLTGSPVVAFALSLSVSLIIFCFDSLSKMTSMGTNNKPNIGSYFGYWFVKQCVKLSGSVRCL